MPKAKDTTLPQSEPIAEMPPPQDATATITMTTDELAASTHPLAPKHPLEIPDAVVNEGDEIK